MGDSGPSAQGTSTASATGSSPSLPATQSLFSHLHFHIHSAIPTKLKADLARLIEAHGGKVHKRLIDLHHPFYALVHPGSPKLAEYAAYVETREPTERGTVVPYSFVRASIAAHHILRPADFQPEPDASHAVWAPLALTRASPRQAHGSSEGARSTADQPQDDTDGWGGLEPVTVHLHVTLAQDERTSLAVKIAKAGGDPTPSMSAARVIIANEDHTEFAQLKKRYEHSPSTYVEPVSWVERCLVKGYYFHDPLQKAPMGGRKPGADRNDFTTEDDTRLAQFIAKRIPNKSEGGRTGNNLYKDLCDRTDIYPWAAGHTWQSWRNRYRKRQDYFDPIIDGYVARRQHNGDGKGEYGYSRGKKRAIREDSPASTPAGRDKRRRSSNEPSMHDQNANASKPTNDPRRKRPDPRERLSPQERPRTSDASAQRSNITTRLAHAAGDTADTTLGLGGKTEYAQSAAVARTESNESVDMTNVPTLDPDPNHSNVSTPGGGLDHSSAYYGYDEFDRDVHDRARDLGLSDYLAQGFTSTW